MKTFTIKADVVRAAQVFQAKNDVRYYLNGVFISDDGTIAGTNGHAGFVSSHDAEIDQGYIIAITGLIPKAAHILNITIIENDVLIKCFTASGRKVKALCGEVLEGKFPDIMKVVPDHSEEALAEVDGMNEITFQAKYMASASKVFSRGGFDGVNVSFKNDSSAIMVTPSLESLFPKGTCVLIMPVRKPS